MSESVQMAAAAQQTEQPVQQGQTTEDLAVGSGAGDAVVEPVKTQKSNILNQAKSERHFLLR